MNRFAILNSIPMVIIASFVIVLILGILVIFPKYQDFSDLGNRVEAKESELQYNEEYFRELDQIKEKLEEKTEEVSKIDSALPQEKSLPSIFNFIQEISSESGLILKSLSPFTMSYSEKFPGIQETRFTVVLSGTYPSFKSFLSVLEKSARMIEAENISFSSEGEEPLKFSLRLKVYSY